MASKLSQLRKGTIPHKVITLRDDFKVAVVVLPTDTIKQINADIEEYMIEHPSHNTDIIRNQMYDTYLCYECMRDPDDLNKRVASDVKETGDILDNEDISRVTTAYGEVMINKAPKIELMTEEEFSDLKKYLEKTALKDLDTVLLVHLKNSHLAMPSND